MVRAVDELQRVVAYALGKLAGVLHWNRGVCVTTAEAAEGNDRKKVVRKRLDKVKGEGEKV